MILALLLILVSILLNIFVIMRKDIYSPSILLVFGYIVSVFLFLLNRNKWYSNLSYRTIFIIILAVLTFLIIEIISKAIFHRKRIVPKNIERININTSKILLVVIFDIITIFFLLQNISMISGISFGDISEMLRIYKKIFLATGANYGLLINLMVKISYAFSFVFLYVFISNTISKKSIRGQTILLLPVVTGFILTILLSNRLTLILYFVFSLISYSLIKNRETGGKYTARIKNYVTIISVSFGFLVLFYNLTGFIGRVSSYDFFDYISIYTSSSIPNFNNYLQTGIVDHDYYFQELFPGLINSFSNIGIFPSSVTKVLEFRWIGPNTISNVYSGLRRMYNNGGTIGIILFQSIFSLVISIFYYRLKSNNDSQRSFGIKLIIYAKLIYTVLLQAVEDHFFINVFSIGYLLETIILIICYYFIINVKFTEPKMN